MIVITKTIQPDATNGIDTYLNELQPTTNYGTNTAMRIRGPSNGSHFLVKIPIISIPLNAIILSATFYINCSSHYSGQKYSIAPSLRAWTELGATWNTYDGSNNWGTAGAKASSDKMVDIISSYEPSSGWNSHIIPLWLINSWRDTNNGLIFYYATGGNSNNEDVFISSDDTTEANRPYLLITYKINQLKNYRRTRFPGSVSGL